MIQTQTLNQLFFLIFGLILTSLFIGTFRVGFDTSSVETRRFWLLSVGARAGAFFSWASIPYFGAASSIFANSQFIFSAGCLALMFRSWRLRVSPRRIWAVIAFSLTIGFGVEIIHRFSPNFALRMVVLGMSSIAMSSWELNELHKKIRTEPETSLKLIAAVVVLQTTLSLSAIISSIIHSDRNIDYVTNNGTKAMVAIWLTLAIHLVIYLFIGGYLYRRALLRELNATQKTNKVTVLLQERERLLASLIASNRVASTGALSASVAHEMSQPLTAAMMKLGLLRRAMEKSADDKQESLGLLGEAINDIGRSKEVLDHLRSLFRQGPVMIRRCNIHSLVNETIELMKSRLDSENIALHYTTSPESSADIVDKEIQQVLINLINNAIDSLTSVHNDGRQIGIEVSNHPDFVRIAISDNGPGVQPELFDTLFELASSDKTDGMGIGLWISRFIVEDHNRGKIYVDGTHIQGARFVIELPRAQLS